MAGVFQGNPFSNLPPLVNSIPAGLQGGTLPLNFIPSRVWTRGDLPGGGTGGGAGAGTGTGTGTAGTGTSGTQTGAGVDPRQFTPAPQFAGGGYASNPNLEAFRAEILRVNPNAQFLNMGNLVVPTGPADPSLATTPGGTPNTNPGLDIYRTQGAGLTPAQLIAYGFMPPPNQNPFVFLGEGGTIHGGVGEGGEGVNAGSDAGGLY